ncbi:Bug family tripartite tricarboxylate transporter substrate binding protein [Pararoseomonas indoligenes]|uniref:Tripartite tricarboxylate transporter substrate binding protein n=1 Tax=Roseomonas indoligenes TaxID=2820811 RepID=A0A940MW75_9PROT|nr:tripartite tricarboxylate transporter substrate binding protein [Pararoseomonas indoligenes]MBP0491626.1 tripartite tricarboxylate transporter substrate binding protein [Pararoseomonas indoligenes]
MQKPSPLGRRALLGGTAAIGLPFAAPFSPALAAFPDHDVRLLVGFSAGGAVDLVARLVTDPLRAALGQNVVVENRPGASGLIAAEAAAKAPPDGHTLYVVAMSAYVVLPQLPGQPMPINMERDLVPVGNVAGVLNALVVSPKSQFRSVPDLIAYAKANPEKLTYASTGNGTSQHLAGELFARQAGIKMTHVPYRGGSNAIVDIAAGRVDMMLGNFPEFIGQIRDGGLRLLAFGGTAASPLFPGTPLIRDTLPGFEVTSWIGLAGPAAMPPASVAAWDAALAKVTADPEFRRRVTENGMEVLGGDGAAFRATIATDRQRWGDVIRGAAIRAE